ncbi:hypothetical protein VSP9026_01687 [Vibrio spartinae]|uniref:Uncharacterized protein n=1 Tax=Vibrio spartinae TaxID=1918945 RepID=A0A1N6M3S2_9VIBR|nr:hypothetical protein VSP9026_01687 [Vibrio spartinae]
MFAALMGIQHRILPVQASGYQFVVNGKYEKRMRFFGEGGEQVRTTVNKNER